MDTSILDIFLGLALGAIGMYWLFSFFRKKRRKELTEHQSTVLLDKIKSVCRLVSVEGEFAEIYRYQNTKEGFMSLWSGKKKALIVINAKAHIGYDLKKVRMHADTEKKKIILINFPQPEILSIEPDLQFYDIKNGFFNSFSPEDLTALNQEAKKHIREKIPQSGLMESARKEALEAVLLMETIVATIGWKLDYSALEMVEGERRALDHKD
ncbi:MAG: DUF4230 domain-containing protein [Sediminicola sp.]|tara:strand:- start:111 stop:743 length:633 start_codon:yes stop_codon:yes gene_type:complete